MKKRKKTNIRTKKKADRAPSRVWIIEIRRGQNCAKRQKEEGHRTHCPGYMGGVYSTAQKRGKAVHYVITSNDPYT